ncbi:MAG: AsmA-like C-terminal region-containing protein [Bryobacteraceae bacterium]
MVVVVLLAGWIIAAPVLSRVARARIISALEENFGSRLEMKRLDVSVFPRVSISGEGLVFRLKDRPGVPPLFTIERFTATANFLGLLARYVSEVRLEGLDIKVPPHEDHAKKEEKLPRFTIGEVIADGTKLTTLPRDAWKEPLVFEIQHLRLYGGGPADALSFDAVLKNAIPPGEIKSSGKFGPWDIEDPGGTPVSGKYTFRDADLSVFKGIAGKLSSDGSYKGSLGHIEASGKTDVPDFRLAVAGNPVHLTAQYEAVIDGTDGNTYLQTVKGQFGHTTVTAKGSVEGHKGVRGKTVSLDAVVDSGRMEDILLLAVKGSEPPISGAIRFHAKLVIPPGGVDVVEKIQIDGAFTVDAAHFAELNVQEKVNELSHRGEGKPKESADDTVASDFKGQFHVDKGVVTLTGLSFAVPGVGINLNGTYGLVNSEMNFRGTAKLSAEVSQTTTGWKSLLLKAVNPIFKKKNVGAEIPIRIGGTPEKPSFGLAL